MKIIELDGLVKLEADKGKVITTLAPSSLRTKLIYLNKNNINDYIEIDEEPEIELPEEPNIEEPEEILNGYTLAEAYYKLINANRVLKERVVELEKVNQEQDKLINTTMLATDEMFMMLEPLLSEMLDLNIRSTSKMVDMYVAMVQRGLKKIDQVPAKYREQVKEIKMKQSNDKG